MRSPLRDPISKQAKVLQQKTSPRTLRGKQRGGRACYQLLFFSLELQLVLSFSESEYRLQEAIKRSGSSDYRRTLSTSSRSPGGITPTVYATVDYTSAALCLKQAFESGKQMRQDFHELYEYLVSTGLEFEAIAHVPNVTYVRATFENDTRTFGGGSPPGIPPRGFMRRENGTLLPHFD
jgi:hypothetical protein